MTADESVTALIRSLTFYNQQELLPILADALEDAGRLKESKAIRWCIPNKPLNLWTGGFGNLPHGIITCYLSYPIPKEFMDALEQGHSSLTWGLIFRYYTSVPDAFTCFLITAKDFAHLLDSNI